MCVFTPFVYGGSFLQRIQCFAQGRSSCRVALNLSSTRSALLATPVISQETSDSPERPRRFLNNCRQPAQNKRQELHNLVLLISKLSKPVFRSAEWTEQGHLNPRLGHCHQMTQILVFVSKCESPEKFAYMQCKNVAHCGPAADSQYTCLTIRKQAGGPVC